MCEAGSKHGFVTGPVESRRLSLHTSRRLVRMFYTPCGRPVRPSALFPSLSWGECTRRVKVKRERKERLGTKFCARRPSQSGSGVIAPESRPGPSHRGFDPGWTPFLTHSASRHTTLNLNDIAQRFKFIILDGSIAGYSVIRNLHGEEQSKRSRARQMWTS